MIVDLFLVYEFIKRLATPFKEWEAYDLGIIDEKGNILKDKRERSISVKERNAFRKFDLLVLKLKKLLEKIPGGQTRLGSYAAALWLIKEHQEKGNETLTEESIQYYMTLAKNINIDEEFEKMMAEEPTMSVGSGAVQGIGYGPKGEPGLTRSQMNRYKKKNQQQVKRFRDMWANN